MSTITRERAQEIFLGNGPEPTASEERELARIALASLEAEAVGEVVLGEFDDCGCHPDARVACIAADGQADWENFKDGTRLYTAPPAPVSVPAAMEMDDDFDSAFEHGKAVGWNACRDAMLHGAELVKAANKLPDDFDFDRFNDVVWLEAVASNPHMHSPTTSTIAMVALELNRKLADGKSPVIPDGWVMVPVEPTAEMISSGITAHFERNQIQIHDSPAPGPMECAYVAMLAAAPQQEVK